MAFHAEGHSLLDPGNSTVTDTSTPVCVGQDLPKTHELPDGNIITVGAKRFRCAEVLFQPKACVLPDGKHHHCWHQTLPLRGSVVPAKFSVLQSVYCNTWIIDARMTVESGQRRETRGTFSCQLRVPGFCHTSSVVQAPFGLTLASRH